MSDKLADYGRADAPLPKHNRLWPLYGAGIENLGRDGQATETPLPQYGPDELLVRHDACGLCFSDTKIIRLGEDHPRIRRRMRADPVVMGHEVTLTVSRPSARSWPTLASSPSSPLSGCRARSRWTPPA